MRMFLIGMTDIFLILYLTAITTSQPSSVFTVEDFYKLKSMHETLEADKKKSDEELEEKLRRAREERERLLAEKKKQEELTAKKLDEEQKRIKEMEQSLLLSDAERERISKDLKEKEKMLKAREQLLASLNKEIAEKEEARQKMEISYKNKLESKRQAVEASQQLAKKLADEARTAQSLADQMKAEASLAQKTAQTAKTVEEKALILKEEALKEKELAEQKAAQALEAMEAAKANRKKAEQKAQKLAATIQDIKQDGETAYNKNIRPQLQKLNVTYERKITNRITVYERELTLLPVKIDGEIYAVFPSRQIGFTSRSDRAPDVMVIMYEGKKVTGGWINKDDDLIAISLHGYEGEAFPPHSTETKVAQFMPALLSLRNDGNVSLGDKIRGISDDYFIVNRDYLKLDKDRGLKFDVPGFRGTGTHGERIVRGDQLVDLNGRLIGVANVANRVIRINTLSGWDEINF